MKLKELEKRLEREPENLGLRVTVAGLMRQAGRSVEAVELYRSVAIAYRDQGRVQQAIAVCRSILEIAPEDAACLGLLAVLQRPPERPSQRSSQDETPLPRPVPHHVADPTGRLRKLDAGEHELPVVEGADTRPGHEDVTARPSVAGLAHAARRISGLISDSQAIPNVAMDLAAEVETRQRPRVPTEQLRKLEQLPETVPTERIELAELMPVPRDSDADLATQPRARIPRSVDEERTQPRERKLFDDDD